MSRVIRRRVTSIRTTRVWLALARRVCDCIAVLRGASGRLTPLRGIGRDLVLVRIACVSIVALGDACLAGTARFLVVELLPVEQLVRTLRRGGLLRRDALVRTVLLCAVPCCTIWAYRAVLPSLLRAIRTLVVRVLIVRGMVGRGFVRGVIQRLVVVLTVMEGIGRGRIGAQCDRCGLSTRRKRRGMIGLALEFLARPGALAAAAALLHDVCELVGDQAVAVRRAGAILALAEVDLAVLEQRAGRAGGSGAVAPDQDAAEVEAVGAAHLRLLRRREGFGGVVPRHMVREPRGDGVVRLAEEGAAAGTAGVERAVMLRGGRGRGGSAGLVVLVVQGGPQAIEPVVERWLLCMRGAAMQPSGRASSDADRGATSVVAAASMRLPRARCAAQSAWPGQAAQCSGR